MKVKILKRTPNELKMEVEGAGHALCNLLQTMLLDDKNVDFAGYDVPHPLASNPIIYVRTKGDVKPERVLREAVKKIRGMNTNFKSEIQKILKT